MREVGAFVAQPHLSELLTVVAECETVTITRRGKAVLVRISGTAPDRLTAFRRLQRLRI